MASSNRACGGNGCILHALRAGSKTLSLDNNHLRTLPEAIVRLKSLKAFSAKNNHLQDDISNILMNFSELTSINLGGNLLTTLPPFCSTLHNLTSLQLFNNKITILNEDVLKDLGSLSVLNLNKNQLKVLPQSISHLHKLTVLSVMHNQLQDLPPEVCQLVALEEIHFEGNSIQKIPADIGNLKKLKKLYLQKNAIFLVPPSIGKCKSLKILELSCNKIQIFPNEIRDLHLVEFHFEHNPLIPPVPLPSDQIDEVLPLKEMVSRHLVNELASNERLARMIQSNNEVSGLLARIGRCVLCSGPFLYSWLDCVEFVQSKKVFKLGHPGQVLPLRIVLCSYACFNMEHNYYGIAIPPDKNN